MEFLLTIQDSELNKLLKLFNNRNYKITYEIINKKDNDAILKVNSEIEDYDLFEDLMEECNSVNIEHMVLNNLYNKSISKIVIFSNGFTCVLDQNSEQIKEYQGNWENIFRNVLTKINHNTSIVDYRK